MTFVSSNSKYNDMDIVYLCIIMSIYIFIRPGVRNAIYIIHRIIILEFTTI